MNILARILSAMVAVGMTVAPAYAAPVSNSAPSVSVDNASTTLTTVQGTVKDDSSAPVAGAIVSLRGTSTFTATTNAAGAFSIAGVAPDVYQLSASKPGYAAATEDDFAVLSGQTQTVTVGMHRATLTSIQTIASSTVHGQSAFNTSTASVNVVTSQQFAAVFNLRRQR